MPIYFTLQEALLASQQASFDFKTKNSGGPKATAEFHQKKNSEIKPPEPPTPNIEPTVLGQNLDLDPDRESRERLQKAIADLKLLKDTATTSKDENVPGVNPEIYKTPPPLTIPLSVVKIDETRRQRQIVEGAQEVQKVYAQQNQEAWFTKGGAKWRAKAKKTPEKILAGTVSGIENMIRHPIATVQNMVREPFENRDIAFTMAVNQMVKEAVFQGNPELPVKLPEEFIKLILEEGKKIRNVNKRSEFWNAYTDLSTSLLPVMDSQQRKGLEWLFGQLQYLTNPDPDRPQTQEPFIKRYIDQFKKESLEYASNLAHGFSQIISNGDGSPLPDQDKYGSWFLLRGETRQQVGKTETGTDQQLLDDLNHDIKGVLRRFIIGADALTEENKIDIMDKINKIYRGRGLVTDEELQKIEIANDIVLQLQEMLKDPNTKAYYSRNWDKVKFMCFLGTSHGETLGGAKKLTKNQELSIKAHENKDIKGKLIGSGYTAAAAFAEAAFGYGGGFLASYALGLGKAIPRSVAGEIAGNIILPFGWAFAYGAANESLDFTIGKWHRESRVTGQLRQVSREKSLLKEGDKGLDFVRNELEEALVTTIPAEKLTKNINELILESPNDWHSETKKNLTSEDVKLLLAAIAHARARVDLSFQSSTKELGHKVQNWVSYHEGHEEEEMSNLKAANAQALARLLHVHAEYPELFKDIPFFQETANGSNNLDQVLNNFETIIKAGLIEGIPSEIANGSSLSTQKGQKFYRQIFSGDTLLEGQSDQADAFLALLKDPKTKIAEKTIAEWSDIAESLKTKEKILNRIKWDRALTAGFTSAATSLALTEAEAVVSTAISSHTQAPPHHESAPANPQTVIHEIHFDNIFADKSNTNIHNIDMWVDGKSQNVPVSFADGVSVIFDKLHNSYDLKDPSGHVYNDFFVADPSHSGAFIANPHFKYDSQTPEVDLSQYVHAIVDKTDPSHVQTTTVPGATENFWQKAADYRLVWGKSEHVIPDKDYVFKTGDSAHPYGVDIHFAEDNIRDPNNGNITSLLSHFEDKTMAVVLDVKGLLPGGKDGHLLIKDCIDKVDDGKGGYYYNLHLDPTSSKVVTLADGSQTTMGQVAQILLNQNELAKHQNIGYPNDSEVIPAIQIFNMNGEILMGYMTEAQKITQGGPLFGHEAIPGGNNLIFQPVHVMSAGGHENPNATFTEPSTSTSVPVPFIQATDLKITYPNPATPAPTPTPPTVEMGTASFTPFPALYHSPQLHPTTTPVSTPRPAYTAATPIPGSVIDRSEFNPERPPRPASNDEAVRFAEDLYVAERHRARTGQVDDVRQKIDDFIIDNNFTEKQKRFLKSPRANNFERQIYADWSGIHSPFAEKMNRENPRKLENRDKDDLRHFVLNEAKNSNLSEQEALIFYEYLVQRSFYDNLYYSTSLINSLTEEITQAQSDLGNLRPAPTPRPNPPPPPTPPARPPRPAPSNHPSPFEGELKISGPFERKLIKFVNDLDKNGVSPSEINQHFREEILGFVANNLNLDDEAMDFLQSKKFEDFFENLAKLTEKEHPEDFSITLFSMKKSFRIDQDRPDRDERVALKRFIDKQAQIIGLSDKEKKTIYDLLISFNATTAYIHDHFETEPQGEMMSGEELFGQYAKYLNENQTEQNKAILIKLTQAIYQFEEDNLPDILGVPQVFKPVSHREEIDQAFKNLEDFAIGFFKPDTPHVQIATEGLQRRLTRFEAAMQLAYPEYHLPFQHIQSFIAAHQERLEAVQFDKNTLAMSYKQNGTQPIRDPKIEEFMETLSKENEITGAEIFKILSMDDTFFSSQERNERHEYRNLAEVYLAEILGTSVKTLKNSPVLSPLFDQDGGLVDKLIDFQNSKADVAAIEEKLSQINDLLQRRAPNDGFKVKISTMDQLLDAFKKIKINKVFQEVVHPVEDIDDQRDFNLSKEEVDGLLDGLGFPGRRDLLKFFNSEKGHELNDVLSDEKRSKAVKILKDKVYSSQKMEDSDRDLLLKLLTDKGNELNCSRDEIAFTYQVLLMVHEKFLEENHQDSESFNQPKDGESMYGSYVMGRIYYMGKKRSLEKYLEKTGKSSAELTASGDKTYLDLKRTIDDYESMTPGFMTVLVSLQSNILGKLFEIKPDALVDPHTNDALTGLAIAVFDCVVNKSLQEKPQEVLIKELQVKIDNLIGAIGKINPSYRLPKEVSHAKDLLEINDGELKKDLSSLIAS